MVNAISMTVKIGPRAQQRLRDIARAKGYSASLYAQMLFDAAFAARVGQERGAPAADAELDVQVRLVFACAGQGDTLAISKATGVPEPRVVRILDGWRQASGKASRKKRGKG